MSWLSYTVVLLVFVFAAIFGWLAVSRHRRRDPASFLVWRTQYRRFIIFFIALLVLAFVASRETSLEMLPQDLRTPFLFALAALLVFAIYLAFRGLELRERRALLGRMGILVLCIGLPGLLYWLLEGRFDELVVAIAVLGSAVAAILLLVWDLSKRRQGGR
jgi:hypothetical protein